MPAVEMLPPPESERLQAEDGADAVEVGPPPGLLADLATLVKPRIIVMSLVAVLVGVHAAGGALAPTPKLIITLLAVGSVAAASFILNQLLESGTDARMARTRNRPLPAGRLTPGQVLAFGIATAAFGLGSLALVVNLPAAFVAALTFSSYVFVYTPLKRHTTWNTVVGAIPGALPPVIGWVAVSGRLDPGAAALFAILFLWQFPHFYAIAWIYRREYHEAGLKMLPCLDVDGDVTSRHILGTALALLPVSLVPTLIGVTGTAYFVGAALLGLLYVAASMAFAMDRTTRAAKTLFRISLVYLPALFLLLSIDLVD